jgi:hypothetical protein
VDIAIDDGQPLELFATPNFEHATAAITQEVRSRSTDYVVSLLPLFSYKFKLKPPGRKSSVHVRWFRRDSGATYPVSVALQVETLSSGQQAAGRLEYRQTREYREFEWFRTRYEDTVLLPSSPDRSGEGPDPTR